MIRTLYLLLLLAVLAWKGRYAWQRGMRTYRRDRREHDSLREYLLAGGATPWQSLWPFRRHALERALLPMLSLWRLWLIMAVLGIVAWCIG